MRAPTTLTPHQDAAVNADAPRLLLVASAGSGKTEVLTRRVIRHLERSPGQTFRVLAITFTVRAAQELQSRLAESAGDEAWRVDADTIHGFAFDWLMRFGQAVNVYPDTVVYADDADRLLLLDEFVRSLGEEASSDLRPVLKAIDDTRTWSATDGERRPRPSVGSIPFSELYDGYLTALEAGNGIDFAGMLSKFIEAAKHDPQFLANFRDTYRHVLVDEGQDLSAAQATAIDLLATPPVDLFVVADDRQAINAFAGGSFANVRTLVGTDAFASPLHLPHNFRCATTVLQAAERVAASLLEPPPSAMAADHAPPGLVRLATARGPGDEAALVTQWARNLLEHGLDPGNLADGEDPTVQPEEIAVVARTRWLLDPLVEALSSNDIEISMQTDPQGFFQTPAGRILANGVALAASSEDAPARRRIADELNGLGLTIDSEDADIVAHLQRSNLDDLVGVGDALDEISVANIEERLARLRGGVDHSDVGSDVNTVSTLWANYAVSVPRHRRDLLGFVRSIARAQQARPSDPGVRVLTIHKVKGLEFKAVAVSGAYNGALPDYRAQDPKAIDEERRAFYVAMTRASRELLVTYPRQTTNRYGRIFRQSPSIFAVEAGLSDPSDV